jgi:hypothetical protein
VTGGNRADPGIFVAVEGADGSGKTAAVTELMELLRQDGRPARRIMRARPSGPAAYAGLVRGVGQLFCSAAETPASWELLSVAAAAQYLAIMQCEIAPAVADGLIVIADSWWTKTWIRLAIEADIRRQHSPADKQRFRAWQQDLLPACPPGTDQQFTVVIEAAAGDRARWYQRAGCPDTVLDDHGAPSRDPAAFAAFTTYIAGELRELAAQRRWPVIINSEALSPAHVADQLRALIYGRLPPSAAGEPSASPAQALERQP